jgi:sulfopyruvate decarboxylase subunit beta
MKPQPMPLTESLRVLHAARTDEVLVTSMGVAREWMTLEPHPLDFHFVPSSMGQATSLGLGIALAQPERRVIVCAGDGSTLMNLGSLVTVTDAAPRNLIVLLFDNGVYEVTGAQLTPGASRDSGVGSRIDWNGLAIACGFRAVWEPDSIGQWRRTLPEILTGNEPVLAVLNVAPVPGAVGPRSPGPAADRAQAFRAALSAAP